MNKRRCVCDGRPSTVYMIARVRLVATTRGQEVHLIRGSEWQTGVRLCPTGVRTALHQGFEPDRRSCKGGEDEAGARLSTKSAPSNAMIANLISSRSLISPEEGGGVLPSVAEEVSTSIVLWRRFTLFTCSFLCHPLEFI